MSSVIGLGSNIASLKAQRRLAEGTSSLSRTFERLASGQRINSASDDAAGLAISDSLRAGSRIFNQAVRNLNDGISLLNIADSAIENLTGIIIRLEELAEQAANGTYGFRQRKALDAEAQALSKEFFRISKTTKFNGLDLLGGSFSTVDLQAGYGSNSVLSAEMGGTIGTGTFKAGVSFGTGHYPFDSTAADFNGDGFLDIATADFAGLTMSVLLGDGKGSFSSFVSYAANNAPWAMTSADFNNDGIIDLATADIYDAKASVFIGNGDGTFKERVSYQTGPGAQSMASGDFNNDGIIDLATGNQSNDTVSVLLGVGDGTFSSPLTGAPGHSPLAMDIGDFNKDGILDIVTTGGNANYATVLFGVGNGTFGTRVTLLTVSEPYGVDVGDFNNDGNLDFVAANSGSGVISLYFGNGDYTFNSAVTYSAGTNVRSVNSGDFNGDGHLDIVVAGRGTSGTSVLMNNGDGTFAPRVTYNPGISDPINVITGDFNGDGVSDLSVSNYGGYGNATISVLIGETRDGVAPLLPFWLSTMADARQAQPVFRRKREQLARQRGELGAFQSRLNVASNVLQVTSENFKAAESRIRDADIAEESSNLIRLNLLQQAAASVLAQANQQPALALRLLDIN